MMSTRTRRIAFCVGPAALLLAVLGATAQAAPSVRTFVMRGNATYADHAVARATITQLNNADYKIHVAVSGLPDAASLRVTPARHVYVVRVLDAQDTVAMSAVIALKPAKAKGAYVADRMVMMMHVTGLEVTAEIHGTPMMGATPAVIVFTSVTRSHG
jgi:hypothetical protein